MNVVSIYSNGKITLFHGVGGIFFIEEEWMRKVQKNVKVNQQNNVNIKGLQSIKTQ